MSVTFWGSVPRRRVVTLMRLSGISTTCTVGRSGVASTIWSRSCWWFYLKPIEGATVALFRYTYCSVANDEETPCCCALHCQTIDYIYKQITKMSSHAFTTKTKFLIFTTPFLFLLFAGVTFIIAPNIYLKIFGILELGLVEWVQFGCYILAAILGFLTFVALRKSSLKFQSYIVLMFCLGCAFVALEEISYGQHIFMWDTPQQIASINAQKETNLHNLAVIMKYSIHIRAFILVGWFGSLAWIFRQKPKTLSAKDIILPEWYLASFFLPLAVFYTQMFFFGFGNNHQETFETVLSFGFLGIGFVNYRKVKWYFLNQLHRSPNNTGRKSIYP